MNLNHPRIIANEHCITGENPLWDANRRCLFWTDIPAGKLFRYDLETQTHSIIYSGPSVGGFTLQADGSLLLFRVDDVALLGTDGVVKSLLTVQHGAARFNDVIADPEGRVFAGTYGEGSGLFRFDLDGTMTWICGATACSNGMGFSPDLRTFYWTCTTRRQIFRFDYERATGRLENQVPIYQASIEEGKPDGLTVDVEGNLWSARWDGARIIKHAPDGAVLDRIDFPVAKVSAVCFGGPELDQMFVTTAAGVAGSTGEDGALYQLQAPVRGRTEFRSRILI